MSSSEKLEGRNTTSDDTARSRLNASCCPRVSITTSSYWSATRSSLASLENFATSIEGVRPRAWRCACQRRHVLCSASKSASKTLRPAQASATAVERARVDFPTPPFCEVNKMWRAMNFRQRDVNCVSGYRNRESRNRDDCFNRRLRQCQLLS